MKIFKWVIDNFKKLVFRLRKKRQEYFIRSRVRESRNTSQSETEEKIRELIASSDPIQEADVVEIIKQQTAKVLSLSGGNAIGNPPLSKGKFDLVEVEQELNKLHLKLFDIGLKESRIDPVYFPQNYLTDKRIEDLEHLFYVHDGKKNLSFIPSAVEKLKSQFGNFDKFLQERLLVAKYQLKEAERVKEFKKFKNEIEAIHIQLNNQIDQNDFQPAKTAIRKLEVLLNSIQKLSLKIIQGKAKENTRVVSNLITKTVELRSKLSFKESEIEAKRQADELKKRQEEAERRRIAEEAKREEERTQIERQAQIQKQQEDVIKRKEEEKKLELQRLIVKKSDWQDFAHVLQVNGITTLYHFTDRANIDYIKRYGGLFSWQYLRKSGIEVPYEGGGGLSKDLDRRYGLEDFVRVCFTENHPMMYVARNEGRIPNPVILKIRPDVCELKNSKFANMNATKNGHNCGGCLDDLKMIKFNIVKQRTHFDLLEQDKPYYQAEILVKTWIPIQYISNINDF